MSKVKEGRVLRKFFISCPNCDNTQLLSVINRTDNQQDIEICLCGWPEDQGFIRVGERE